ncbi:venom serine carboxypeptidase-like [Galendromus occidentalis]|uniref:Venom serine carboxypeptidase-like n=1 Tax=Galendromus occidentalis TaxID=34638 RepID=A0AAJ7WJ56_9ACAR|nr:venom serine carboxypeptidase-like [Galendromus occidentalis]
MGVILHRRTDPLLLSPYIKTNQTETARRLALIKVESTKKFLEMIRSYSGFITVNEKCQSNMFFWFFPRLRNDSSPSKTEKDQFNTTSPLVLWMQGGPGASSLFGLFVETGPFQVNMDLTLTLRPTSWLKYASLLYLDNPVGSGFSFTADEDCYPTDQQAIGDDLTDFVRQFYVLFPEFISTPLYIGGQSYAGKYVPTLSYRLATDEGFAFVPLQGMIIGNGFSDPIHMLEYGDFLEGVGLLNREQADEISQQTKIARKMIRLKMYVEAYALIDQLIVGAFTPQGTIIQNLTGIGHYYNILRSGHPPEMTFFYHYLHMERVKKAIHAGGRNISDGAAIRRALIPDMMQSVADQFAKLLDNGYRVLFYSGQLDIIVNYVCVENFFHNLVWSGAKKWRNTKRKQWRIDGPQVVGFVRQVNNLTEVMIRNAGHIAPFDQPWPTLDMFRRFIDGLQFN